MAEETVIESPKWRRVIDAKEDGTGGEVFEADSAEELVEKIAAAKENANRKIREQNQELKRLRPVEVTQAPQKQELTPDDRFRLTQELQDPTKAPEAIRKIVDADLGSRIDTIEQANRMQAEAVGFIREVEARDNFLPCAENQAAFEKWLSEYKDDSGKTISLPPTRKNLQIAYDDLRDAGLLRFKEPKQEAKKEEEKPAEESRIARPRGSQSSSLRTSNSTAANVAPSKKGPSWAEIQAMSTDEYKNRLRNEPGFREYVDNLKPATR